MQACIVDQVINLTMIMFFLQTSAVLKAEYLQQTLHLSASGSKKNVKADCFLVQILWKNPRNFNCEIPVPQSLGTISSLVS